MERLLLDRVAFTIFGHDIYWYGVFMCLAIVAAILTAMIFCKKRGISVDVPLNIALIVIPVGILFGRLFAVLFDSDLSFKEFFNFRTGGMSIIGCIIGGAIGLTVYSLIKKGIVSGYLDGTFKPNNSITRAEVVKMTNIAINKQTRTGLTNIFYDLTPDFWAYDYILTAATK